ncbi:hypothetical protein UC34_04735 [Pandoraea vervacti]|uniref:Translocation protein in type III secretion n=1 Tax=Pandoraea vervacti TaxID=656178 RepID=A0ABN4FLW6_9BURK|nr:hypothetical protein [Pandoraea vervacti]AJP56496.1 hypothetical protein UC34_04735 [Pandoraea vervacti]
MRPETLPACAQKNEETVGEGASIWLEDLLAGRGCVVFNEDDTEVRVGWMFTGGDGLVVTAHVDEGVVGQIRFWCDAQQWADWLAEDLPVATWEDLPPPWHASAASLTLATGGPPPTDGDTSETTMPRASWPKAVSISRAHVDRQWRVGIMLSRDGRRLTLPLLDGATAWLRERCQHAMPCDTPLDPKGYPMRRCAMAVGWSELPASLCDSLSGGGAALLDVAADVCSGEYWLIDGAYAIAMRDGQPVQRRVVLIEPMGKATGVAGDGARSEAEGEATGATRATTGETTGETTSGAAKAERMEEGVRNGDVARCVRLLAVIAEKEIPLPWLMAWRKGHETSPSPTGQETMTAGHIALWRDGSHWADGRLLRFGDGRLAVQVDPGLATPAAANGMSETISGRDPMADADAVTASATEAIAATECRRHPIASALVIHDR